MSNWLIFTDLDDTLLDHNDYSFTPALPALNKIRQLQIPLIINTSKTYAEVKDIRKKMHNNWAFAVENGAAVYLPGGQLSGSDDKLEQQMLGRPQIEILNTLQHLREQYNYSFKGFSDFTVAELMNQTSLTEQEAKQAKQRQASEPLKWMDSQQNLALFEQQLADQGLQLIQGGRFLHVMGNNDKSLAMAWLLNKFKQQQPQPIQTLALGDSQNDLRMLEQADFAAVIVKSNGNYLKLNNRLNQVLYSKYPAPLGWQEVMEQLFIKLNLGT